MLQVTHKERKLSTKKLAVTDRATIALQKNETRLDATINQRRIHSILGMGVKFLLA